MAGLQELEKHLSKSNSAIGGAISDVAQAPADRGSAGVNLRILLPFTVLLLFVVGLFLVSTFVAEKRANMDELMERAQAVQRLFHHELEEDASMMHGTLDAITQDRNLETAFIARDRAAILRQVLPLFESIQRDHNMTYFYFIGPDRKNLLRIHEPDRHGDVMTRATVMRAERTGKIAHGLELDKSGILTLRAVMPWKVNGRLIGYVELGHDVGGYVEKIGDILGVDMLVMIYKKYVSRLEWAARLAASDQVWQWNRLETTVIIAGTLQAIPNALAQLLEEERHPYQIVLPLQENVQQAHVTFLPLYDTANREFGDLVVIRDITEEHAAFRNSMIVTTVISLVAGGAVFVLFLMTLHRLEMDYRRKREVEAQFSKLSREHERIVQVEKLSAIGMMIGEIAHQINNPLVGVVNMTQLAQRNVDDPARTSALLTDILNAGKHCHAFVKRMVEFTKISRSEYRQTEIRKLVDETIVLFRQSTKLHPPVIPDLPDLPVTLEVDPVMLRHAYLLTNAAQASAGADDGTITVRVFRKAREKDARPGWCIAVEDSGPGLSKSVREHMFTPFFSTRSDGTGLGLPVVQYVANLHEGYVHAANNPNGGACFTLWLPERKA